MTQRRDGSPEEEKHEKEKERVISDAEKLVHAFKDASNCHLEDKEILRIFNISSKCHLEAVYKQCKRIGAEPSVLSYGLPSFLSHCYLYLNFCPNNPIFFFVGRSRV